MKRVPKLIFACDISDVTLGLAILDKIAPHIDVVKIGLEAMNAEEEEKTVAQWYRNRALRVLKKKVMWDMKLLDVANTMAGATHNISKHGSSLFTLHAQASEKALRGVVENAGTALPLAVTVLTDLDDEACVSRFACDSPTAVLRFAQVAYDCGIRGFVCSAKEAVLIRNELPQGNELIIVTPAIRPEWAVGKDEQRRVTTPTQAAWAGADYIVVGRPIYAPPVSMTEDQAAREIQKELADA